MEYATEFTQIAPRHVELLQTESYGRASREVAHFCGWYTDCGRELGAETPLPAYPRPPVLPLDGCACDP